MCDAYRHFQCPSKISVFSVHGFMQQTSIYLTKSNLNYALYTFQNSEKAPYSNFALASLITTVLITNSEPVKRFSLNTPYKQSTHSCLHSFLLCVHIIFHAFIAIVFMLQMWIHRRLSIIFIQQQSLFNF